MRGTQREAETGRERSRLHAGSLMRDLILGLQDHALGQREMLNHRATQASLLLLFSGTSVNIWWEVLMERQRGHLGFVQHRRVSRDVESMLEATQSYGRTWTRHTPTVGLSGALLKQVLEMEMQPHSALLPEGICRKPHGSLWPEQSLLVGLVAQRFSATFSPGHDPGVSGSSPTLGSLCGTCFSLCLCLCLSLSVSLMNK